MISLQRNVGASACLELLTPCLRHCPRWRLVDWDEASSCVSFLGWVFSFASRRSSGAEASCLLSLTQAPFAR